MRCRIRGPTGQSVIALSDEATVGDLRTAIAKETALPAFEIKIGYPPTKLELDNIGDDRQLAELGVKLNGEQLLVTSKEPAISKQGSSQPQRSGAANSGTSSQLAGSSRDHASSGQAPNHSSDFSFYPAGPSRKAASSSQPKRAADFSLSRKSNNQVLNDPPEIALAEHGGSIVLRIMPDDNSCLFRAVAAAVMPGLDAMNELRSVVAQTIQANPELYSKAVLDNKEPDLYCQWIQTEDAWGGQIELKIIADHFDIEICSIDVQTLRIDRYNEDRPKRCIVVYSGIHYDTIALSPFDAPPDFDKMIFEANDEVLLSSAVELCEMLKKKGYYTDTAAFKIRCKQCGAVCVGEVGATEHASKTGHYDFDEGA